MSVIDFNKQRDIIPASGADYNLPPPHFPKTNIGGSGLDLNNPPAPLIGNLRWFFSGVTIVARCESGFLYSGHLHGWYLPDTYNVGTDTYSLTLAGALRPWTVLRYSDSDCNGTLLSETLSILMNADFSGSENLDCLGSTSITHRAFTTGPLGIGGLPIVGEKAWFNNTQTGAGFSAGSGGRVLVDRTG